jgi:hypothetical protein
MSATIGDVAWLLNSAAGSCCGVHLKEKKGMKSVNNLLDESQPLHLR